MNEPKTSLVFLKWLLSADHRLGNSSAFAAGIAFVAYIYIAAKERHWFPEIVAAGPLAVAVGLFCAFLFAFLMMVLVWRCVAGLIVRFAARREERDGAHTEQARIRDTLVGLTEWQRSFVLRFIVQNQRLIAFFEVGGYSAVWEPEMDVLLRKRVIVLHPGGMYELSAKYRLYLDQHWDQETGTLA